MGLDKLTMIQTRLKAPKDRKNTFGGYSYRSCEGILEAVKPLLAEAKASLIISDEIELIGDRFYVRATARLFDCDTGEVIGLASAFRREAESKKGMDESQITGSASSYARKYALNGLFAIDDSKDADTDEYRKEAERKAKVCEVCGKKLTPKVAERSAELFEGHLYCSKECAEKGKEISNEQH